MEEVAPGLFKRFHFWLIKIVVGRTSVIMNTVIIVGNRAPLDKPITVVGVRSAYCPNMVVRFENEQTMITLRQHYKGVVTHWVDTAGEQK